MKGITTYYSRDEVVVMVNGKKGLSSASQSNSGIV